MRAVVQRVSEASVVINREIVGSIRKGLLVYLAVQETDQEGDADYLLDKILGLRIFDDETGKMNLPVTQVRGALLIVSQFTLYGDCRKGKRPSFSEAASTEKARILYEYFVGKCRESSLQTQTGAFQARMQVSSRNEGPVTILVDSKKLF
jgi:D-tyrosyl-tRNA(Tyr) deacylase